MRSSRCVLVLLMIVLCQAPEASGAASKEAELARLSGELARRPATSAELFRLAVLQYSTHRFDEAISTWRQLLSRKEPPLSIATKARVVYGIALANCKLCRGDRATKYIRWANRALPGDPKIGRAFDAIAGRRVCCPAPAASATASAPATPVATVAATPSPTAAPIDPARARAAFASGEQAYRRARLLLDQGRDESDSAFTEAIAFLEVARRSTDRHAKALYYLGSARLHRENDQEKDVARAREVLEESLKEDPDPKTAFELGQACGILGQVDRQIEAIEKAIHMDPQVAEYHYRLALAYDVSGRKDAPSKTFEHAKLAIKFDPKYKARFQNALKNSVVAADLAKEVGKIIDKTETGDLTDQDIERIARDMAAKFNLDPATGPKPEDISAMRGKIEDLRKNNPAALQKLLTGPEGERIRKLVLERRPGTLATPSPHR